MLAFGFLGRRTSRLEPATARKREPDDDMTASSNKPAAIRVVIPFVFRHWLDQPWLTLTIAIGLLGARWPIS
jgi:hypothetical protein